MSKKFKNTYRISSARCRNWDYASSGAYFVTVCTADRNHWFGHVDKGKMILNVAGNLLHDILNEMPEHFSFVKLDAFVIMPNHIHCIILINNGDDADAINGNDRDAINRVSIGTDIRTGTDETTNEIGGGITGNHNPMFHNNLSRIVRWFKGRATFEIKKSIPAFAWQPRFHDHIIRNEISYKRIKQYIYNNPKNWNVDKTNS